MLIHIVFLHFVLSIALLLLAPIVSALDTAAEEAICGDIGFTKGTEAFGGCVLELLERNKNSSVAAKPQGDGSEGDRLCQQYGFTPGENDYSECRLQLTIAKEKALADKKRYELELAQYQRELAREKERKDVAEGVFWLNLGACLLGECPQYGTANSTNSPPPPPPAPINTFQEIRMPNGRYIRCNTLGTYTDCR